MVDCIGTIGLDSDGLRRWTATLALSDLLRTTFAPGRRECWYGIGNVFAGRYISWRGTASATLSRH